MKILLDSTFLIDQLRGDRMATDRMLRMNAAGDDMLVDPVVLCEVRFGVRDTEMPSFLSLLAPLEVVSAGRETALIAGHWRMRARAGGHHLGLSDALIAATAYSVDAAVITRNARDFALTPVRIETY